jgi:L-iditol 2-dehydrogenase
MRFGRLSASGSLELGEQDEPAPGEGEVTVRLAACGVCGTDLEKLRGNYRTAGILGHEPVGRIARVGRGVAGLSEGDRVFAHHHVPCLACPVCARGDLTFCPEYSRTNLDPGGFAEVFRVPAANVARGAVLPLDRSIDWSTGALLEPAGCVLTALHRLRPPPGASYAVLGLGPIGLLYARIARALGASWIGGTDLSELRRTVARRGGVDVALDPRGAGGLREAIDRATEGRGVDVAVVATGDPAAVRSGAELLRRGGTLNLMGLPTPNSRLDYDLQQLYLRGIQLVPTYATTEADLREVHRLLVQRRLALSDLVSHRVPLERIAEAFAIAGRPEEAVKVVVTGPADS